ncbi:hypothetical protein SAPIO_CDS8406 [Scedosporium apiospermum]|uniref:Uncharacterized protein n=1 Tax=Pseudallescheria apiosperma TaxID=563466 RepID=A0A084FZJ6_PSEDA|nr:uncharacterized protein SAPIO_CDS8406 [Scedosporium apiospermum]KEZ40508.1 hypothetical protein SAPIO_CDS8406 [Scedosporium apiospermum]
MLQGGHGNKIPYPKHVWSPAGGWYCQPANWKQNTFVLGAAVFGLTCIIWKISAEKEQFAHKPEPGRFYPSRYWTRQLINWEKEDKLKAEQQKSA